MAMQIHQLEGENLLKERKIVEIGGVWTKKNLWSQKSQFFSKNFFKNCTAVSWFDRLKSILSSKKFLTLSSNWLLPLKLIKKILTFNTKFEWNWSLLMRTFLFQSFFEKSFHKRSIKIIFSPQNPLNYGNKGNKKAERVYPT